MRILVVEDEKKTTAFLRKGLTEHGFAVDVAAEGTEGLSCALADAYELLILDVMLPSRDGWFVLRELARPLSHPDLTGVVALLGLCALGGIVYLALGAMLGVVNLAELRVLMRRQPGVTPVDPGEPP